VYLHLNMVWFPFLGLQEQPIYKIFKSGTYELDYIRDFSMLKSTPFFVNLIVQYGVFSSMFYLLRLGEILAYYLSPRVTDYMRSGLINNQGWRRPSNMSFQYGYFYSQMITVFTIVVLFSSVSPLVGIAGTFYYILRNIVDSHLLMSVHKKEMHSGVTMFQRISSLLLFSLMLYQAWMLVYFFMNNHLFQAICVTIMLCATAAIFIILRADLHYINLLKEYSRREKGVVDNELKVFRLSELTDSDEESKENSKKPRDIDGKFDARDWEKWQAHYDHPWMTDSWLQTPAGQVHQQVKFFIHIYEFSNQMVSIFI